MKKIVRFVFLELGLLKRTVIVIGLILAIFSAAFLSVLSVLIDVPLGLYNALNETMEAFECVVYDVSLDDTVRWGGNSAYAEIEGLTSYADIKSTTGVFHTEQTVLYGSTETTYYFNGCAVGYDSAESFSAFDSSIISGAWIDGAGQICVSDYVAESFGFSAPIAVGDKITINDEEFKVVGIYNYDSVRSTKNFLMPSRYFYISLDGGRTADVVHITYSDSRSLNEAYKNITRRGVEAFTSGIRLVSYANKTNIFSNVDLVEAFFMAVSIVLGIILTFILYSLIAIFYRQRKNNICRMKLLGAGSGTIAGIYCCIAIALVVLAVAIGSALSVVFNIYFMNLCTSIFGYKFASHFYFYIPLSLFAALTVISLCIYAHFNRKIKNTAIAQEMRHE